MKKYLILILFVEYLLHTYTFAFPPPSPDQEEKAKGQVNLCESTGGTASKTYVGGYDPETKKDMAWGILVKCDCPENYIWDNTSGCIPPISNQTQINIIQK